MYGAVMDTHGENIIVGTGEYNFFSKNYGKSWSKQKSSPSCGLMTASSDLKSIACVGGKPGGDSHVYVSNDSGETYTHVKGASIFTFMRTQFR